MRRVGGQREKGSEWWNEEVGGTVAEKIAFEGWLQRRDRFTYDRYRVQRVVMKTCSYSCRKNGGLAMGRAIWE